MALSTAFFQVTWREDPSPVASGLFDHERIFPLMDPADVAGWEKVVFQVEGKSEELADYLASTPPVRLCSPRMRAAIDQGRGPNDRIQWLEADVVDATGNHIEYSVMHLPQRQEDVLDLDRSVIIRHATHDSVVRPVLDSRKASGRHVMRTTDSALNLVVSDEMRKYLLTIGCTGVEFGKLLATSCQ